MQFHSLVSGMQASNGNCQILAIGPAGSIFFQVSTKTKMSSMWLAALCQDIPMDDTPEQLFHAHRSRETFLLKLESQNRKTHLTYMTFSLQIYPAFHKAVIMPSRYTFSMKKWVFSSWFSKFSQKPKNKASKFLKEHPYKSHHDGVSAGGAWRGWSVAAAAQAAAAWATR